METRLDRLSARRFDPLVTSAKLLGENWRSIAQSDSVKYSLGAMQPIDPEYTRNTFLQGERVKSQLETNLAEKCDYEYQGSTTNDTHIKAASDIDLLVITRKFWTLQPPQQAPNPYTGNPAQDLLDLRNNAVEVLKNAFPKATVDASGSKSVYITGGSLTRKVDVVPANWFDTNDYASSKDKIYRGVGILNTATMERTTNTPFLHNALVALQDIASHQGFRKAARLMKSLKYDSDSIDLTSYDIVAIAYNIPATSLQVPRGFELKILAECFAFVSALQADQSLRNGISVPDSHRKVFAAGHATNGGLNQLAAELNRLIVDVLTENQRSFRKLADARIDY